MLSFCTFSLVDYQGKTHKSILLWESEVKKSAETSPIWVIKVKITTGGKTRLGGGGRFGHPFRNLWSGKLGVTERFPMVTAKLQDMV